MVVESLIAVLTIIVVAVLFSAKDDFGTILKESGPIKIYARGYGLITQNILGNYGSFIAIMILNAFILTTLDTATRISRYLTEELFKLKNRYLSTLLIVILGATLALSGKWMKIWPVFGASNQLVAALALFVLTCWLLSKHKTTRFTLGPAFFMLLTTVLALLLGAIKYFIQKDILLFVISVILIVLAGFMFGEVIDIFTRRKRYA
jgi:carbon starvation protein